MEKLYIGVDSGTQGTKAVVFGEERGIIAESYSGYDLAENVRGGREQDPALWVEACRKVISAVLTHPDVQKEAIKAISISGQQHGMVALDSAGAVIRPAKLWCDTETTKQCQTITERVGGRDTVAQHIGNQVAVGFTASKVVWLKENEPENYARLATVLLPHDYLNFWLTGEKKMEYGDASGTAYFDVKNRCWSKELAAAIDPDGNFLRCLPELIEADEPCGTILPTIANEFGLAADVIVASGGGDNMMGAIGTGNVQPGVVTASLGTSGTIYAYSDTPVIDQGGELAAFCSSSGGWLPLICTMNVTVATELIRKLLGMSIADLNEAVAAAPVGSEGLLLLPYFNGERTPALPEATATFAGMTTINMKRENMARAAMEGASFGLRYGLELMKKCGINPTEVRLIGGGAKSKAWCQMIADIFNCTVVRLQDEEAGALGAALQAIWCHRKSIGRPVALTTLAEKYVHLQETCYKADSENAALYDEIYANYIALDGVMRQSYQGR